MSKVGKVVLKGLIKSPWCEENLQKVIEFSPADQTHVALATARATFLPFKLDGNLLEKCLKLVLEDIPVLGGRMHPVKLPFNWKMGDLKVDNNNTGAELVVIDAEPLSLADCGPDTWPMKNVTISNPQIPFYLPSMDVGKALLSGAEPLCKVQLTLLVDGCVLGITLSHTITDGMHWPALMRHIAARYRQVSGGKEASAEELVSQRSTRPQGLSLDQLKLKFDRTMSWKPETFNVSPSLADYLKAGKLLWSNCTSKKQYSIYFLPRNVVMELKAKVLDGSDLPITTGDVVQALAALMIHIAEGQPLLPILPRCMVALIQIPGAEPTYFGNAVHPMAVGLDPQEATLPPTSDALATLRTLASQIRRCTLDLRQDPSKALQAIYESQQVVDAPVLKALSFLIGHRLPYITCTTNYIGSLPVEKALDFGTGLSPLGYRSLTYPLVRGMGVIRPSMAPYDDGLFLSMSLSASQLKSLKHHSYLSDLVSGGKFVGQEFDDLASHDSCWNCWKL